MSARFVAASCAIMLFICGILAVREQHKVRHLHTLYKIHKGVYYERIQHTYAVATAYCDHGRTADGTITHTGVVAVDPRVISLGSTVWLNHHRYHAHDTGGAIRWRGGRGYADIDIFMPRCASAWAFGRKVVLLDRFKVKGHD